MASLYDYPQYYDLAFREDNILESNFLEDVWRGFSARPVRRVLEPGCGSGRLVVELASRGYDVTAFDLSQPSLQYLRRRLARRGLSATVFRGDMTDFQVERPADAAHCLINTFRHLTTDLQAYNHLTCVARALRPGGLYALGFHLLPDDVAQECIERFRGRRGKTTVAITLRVLEFDRQQRLERWRLSMLTKTPQRTIRCQSEFPMRLYTAQQWRDLYETVNQLELIEIFDFDYDVEVTRELDDDLCDAVFLFRKK